MFFLLKRMFFKHQAPEWVIRRCSQARIAEVGEFHHIVHAFMSLSMVISFDGPFLRSRSLTLNEL